MNTSIIILDLVLLTLVNTVNAQLGYIRKGGSYIQGNIFDQGKFKNNRELIFIEKTDAIIYRPDQIEEYGFVNGDAYIRRHIHDGQKTASYFLRRLVGGRRTLYELHEKTGPRFFIEHDSSLIELRNGISLKDQLSQQLNPCGSSQQIAESTRYGEASLKRAVFLSNQCFLGFFPHIRKGVFVGLEVESLPIASTINQISLQASGSSPLVGFFFDLPLGMTPSWFMNIQATYQQNNYNGFQSKGNLTLDYQYNFSTIGFPLLLKYQIASSTWRPFVALGPTPAIYIQQQNAWITTRYEGSNAFLNYGTWDNAKMFQISGTLCAGLEYSITPHKSVSLEIRFKKLIDAQVGTTQSFALLGSYYF